MAVPATSAADEPSPPDVILIVTDDQRWDTLWAMPLVGEELVARGVTFADAFVVNPICCPSRASIFTGDYSHTTLVYRQTPPFGRVEWFDDSSTLATWLDGAGYETGLFGKYLDGYQHAGLTGSVPPGWDRWVAFIRSGYEGVKLSVDGEVREPGGYSTDVLAAEAVGFIRRAEGPLFLTFAPAAPHAPAIAAPADREAFGGLEPARPSSFDEADVSDKPGWVRALPRLDRGRVAAIDAFRRDQYRSLLAVDRAVGEILDALEETGRLENSLIAFTSDNGIHHGEHRWTKKESPYEESVRVPLVIRWDAAGWVIPGRRVGDLVLNIDLAPTIIDAVGISAPPTDGSSLLPLLSGDSSAWRDDFLIEHLEGSNPVPTFCAVRSAEWKYVYYATREEELYRLSTDPAELENLAADPTVGDALERMRGRLRELCQPPPPGLREPRGRFPVALVLISGLVVAEALSTRRRSRKSRGASR